MLQSDFARQLLFGMTTDEEDTEPEQPSELITDGPHYAPSRRPYLFLDLNQVNEENANQ